MLSKRPTSSEQSEYHQTLTALVPDGPILQTLVDQVGEIATFLESTIPEDQVGVVHPPYGWSVRQVIEHCIDAERVFGYRVLRLATDEKVDLPGWDENHYAACGYGPNADMHALSAEYQALRGANLALLDRLEDAAWDRMGTADNKPFSVRTIAWLMAGHWIHHKTILEKRLAG